MIVNKCETKKKFIHINYTLIQGINNSFSSIHNYYYRLLKIINKG